MPDPIDISVGSRIRFYRKSRHVSQMELAKRIGVTFQQVQKYENGKNRVFAKPPADDLGGPAHAYTALFRG